MEQERTSTPPRHGCESATTAAGASDHDRHRVRFRGRFTSVTGELPDGDTRPSMRPRHGGSASQWGFAAYHTAGLADDTLDTVCGLYLNDPTAWTQPANELTGETT